MPRMGGPNRGVPEKSKDFKGSIKRLLKGLSDWKLVIYISLTMAMIGAILSLITPNKLSNLTDEITLGIKPNISEKTVKNIMSNPNISNKDKMEFNNILSDYSKDASNTDASKLDKLPKSIYKVIKPKMNISKVKSLSLFLAVIIIISALFNYIESYLMANVSNSFAKKLRKKVIKKINKMPLRYFDSHETGDVLSRLTNDIDAIGHNLNSNIVTLITSITLFIGSIIMMFVTNWIMTITAILSSLLGFSIMSIILKKSQIYFTLRQKQLGDLNGYIEEIYSGHNIVKVYNGEKEVNDNFDELNLNLYDSNRKSAFLSGLMPPLMGFIGNIGYVAVCVVGALLVTNNHISFGVIVAFMIYVKLFINPLSQIAQAMSSFQSVAAASERVFEFLDEEEMLNESNLKNTLKKTDIKGKIEFKNIEFGYDSNKTIIRNFSATALPGQKIAIVGPTGAGKTTIVNLLMKFYDVNHGDILIDDTSIKDLTRENVHNLFTMVLQDTWLFEGTIRENLVYNKEGISDEEVMEACKTVGVDHFIKTLPGGLDSDIKDNDSISQGQKQLLTIARGMIEDAPLLILDEATSNVDTRTEELVQKAMDKLTKGKTSFIIAHRLSTIKNADLILVMKEGNIIEQGNHEDLISKNGFYAELYNSQFDTIS